MTDNTLEQPYQPYMDSLPPGSSRPGTSDSEFESRIHPGNAATSIPKPVDFTQNAPSLPSPPFITVEGVPNFRDLGGYACPPPPTAPSATAAEKSYRVKKGLVYRCATLSQITPAGCATLTSTLTIRHLYDLRSLPEVSKPDAVPSIPDQHRHFTPVYQNEDYSPAALARKYSWYTADDPDPCSLPLDQQLGYSYSPGFVKAYHDIATHGSHAPDGAYRVIFRHVLERPHAPFILHCTAGKDRTGVGCALMLKLCGVADDVVADEYALTSIGLGSWKLAIAARMTRSGGHASLPGGGTDAGGGMTPAEADRLLGSRAANMRAFLTLVLEREFGGVHRYLVDMCGFSDDEVARIRENLIEEGPGHDGVPGTALSTVVNGATSLAAMSLGPPTATATATTASAEEAGVAETAGKI